MMKTDYELSSRFFRSLFFSFMLSWYPISLYSKMNPFLRSSLRCGYSSCVCTSIIVFSIKYECRFSFLRWFIERTDSISLILAFSCIIYPLFYYRCVRINYIYRGISIGEYIDSFVCDTFWTVLYMVFASSIWCSSSSSLFLEKHDSVSIRAE